MNAGNLSIGTLTPFELKEMLSQGDPPLVLDVREPEELAICALPDALHIPLGNLPSQTHKLPEGRMIVALCHHGRRSLQAALFLKAQGIEQVLNLAGGIDAWAQQVAPSMARY